ncbi:acyl-CoA dehydrogenase NM domain-like protein [Gloeophyllum trabeum ATCC 11539]|uniref:Acyl-CoA dehydrogenase NM domain-like protein n=1 Tax=Gloeophyllum trabeum (strain ATCC 11539 / FP-39264 / Madison 617) TaxID=670483 RepID=S7RJS1_GLOTA|nr:acyl-CoA dehydrogenase NM domain-like protein [Gloeophyllum trabeum ATCC 11539]EPQ54605.1 acyl-CoA dehydrogenase NM domain-like protein [Gloeophyllum trabeum ATCC 11539]
MRVEQGFQPVPYSEGNPYTADPVLPCLLRRLFPKQARDEIEPDLERFGNDILTTVRDLADLTAPPTLTQYNHWGQRTDALRLSEGWRQLTALAQKEGIVAIAYERRYGALSRVYGSMKVLMATADTRSVFCPMSMTDGCARVIELHGTPAMKAEIYPRLISRDPSHAFTSGQWMTERPGGSDVSLTETTATPLPPTNASRTEDTLGPAHSLDGFKWFSSATDSDVALALARTGPVSEGARALSLFLVPLRLPLLQPNPLPPPRSDPYCQKPATRTSTSNGIFIHRLKHKFGTHALPTAELSLSGTLGYPVGPRDRGVKTIAAVLNITRVYSASLEIARAYAAVRTIRGGTHLLSEDAVHVAELARVSTGYRAAVHLVFGAVRLLGRSECGAASEGDERRLRLLTPLAKAFAAELAGRAMPECMAALGGQGYMEETGIGRCIRDGLVEQIWEGTTTVLALDLQRVAQSAQNMSAFLEWADNVLASMPPSMSATLEVPCTLLQSALKEIQSTYTPPVAPLVPRPALFLFGYVASALYLLEHAVWSNITAQPEAETDIEVFRRWVMEGELQRSVDAVRVARSVDPGSRFKKDHTIVYGDTSSLAKL